MTAREMPEAAASREISAMKALKSPPHCAAGAELANKTERTNAASRRLVMPTPFSAAVAIIAWAPESGQHIGRREKAGALLWRGGRRGSLVERLIDRFESKAAPRGFPEHVRLGAETGTPSLAT